MLVLRGVSCLAKKPRPTFGCPSVNHVQCMYDFYTDTLIRIQICGGRYDYGYYIKFQKGQENDSWMSADITKIM